MANNNILLNTYNEYEKTFNKYNLYYTTIMNIEQYFTITCRTIHRVNRKVTEDKTEEISTYNYLCYISSIPFFHDRVTKCAVSMLGYIPTKIKCYSPSGEESSERIFTFKEYKKTEEELDNYYCDRKSFYKKAYIIDTKNYILLKSYDTIVAQYNKSTKEIEKTWNGYSSTTMRHIRSFSDYIERYHELKNRYIENRIHKLHHLTEKKTWENLPISYCARY